MGYSFDLCPANAAMARMSVTDGRIVLPDGAAYRVLVLPDSETMTPRLLAKLKALVRAGATIVGPKPIKSPSLEGYPRCDVELAREASELWGDCDGLHVTEHRLGKGRVICGKTARQVLMDSGVPPDFEPATAPARASLRYLHRTLPGAEVFFVANRSSQVVDSACAFRVHGAHPELWWPDTGRLERIAAYDTDGQTVQVPMRLDPFGSVFVVFRADPKAEGDRVVTIRRNGQTLWDASSARTRLRDTRLETARSNRQIPGFPASTVDGTNTFTIAVWAKPEADIELLPESNFGKSGFAAERNDALYPPPGHEVYHSPEQAGAGLSIGRNGVCVFEHTAYYFAPVLAFAAPLTHWTHVAVVYSGGRPSLFLNGAFVHQGQQSTFTVHSGVGVAHWRRPAPFQGDLGDFFNVHQALMPPAIDRLAKLMPIPDPPPRRSVQIVRTTEGALAAEVWEPGDYVAVTARGERLRFAMAPVPPPLELAGCWDVRFPPDWGAPEEVKLDHLISWSEHPNPGVRHFSGTATYTKSFTVPPDWFGFGRRLYLDLGKVEVTAQVKINGREVGTLWKPPFCVDVTGVVKPGENLLAVDVVNLWPNRMIGDEALPEDSDRKANGTLKQWPGWLQSGQPSPGGRYTFTSWRLWKKEDPLRESGLLGPVRFFATRVVALDDGARGH